jgi:hypothetical protein
MDSLVSFFAFLLTTSLICRVALRRWQMGGRVARAKIR